MTIDEAIALVKIERECVIRADVCDRKCETCDLLQDSTKLTDMYEQVAEWLEELKAYREKKCNKSVYLASKSIDKIDAVNKGYIDGYNKAIDDFIHECDKYCGFYSGKNKSITREDILKIAEQLKE